MAYKLLGLCKQQLSLFLETRRPLRILGYSEDPPIFLPLSHNPQVALLLGTNFKGRE